jgi:3-dehydroquinate dehydratase/shikimate dehydrogenase
MLQICVSLTEPTSAQVVARLPELSVAADLVEVRGDCIGDLDLLAILRAKDGALLFCCRPTAQGGRYDGDEERRRLILLEAVKRGYDYVDVELESGFLDVMAEKAGRGLVVSHHDHEGTPDDLAGLYARMAVCGADVVKLAVTPRSLADVGRLLDLAADVARGGGPPLVAIAMGPLGLISRLAAGRDGAPFTYASQAAGREAAPGQVPLAEMADLYRVRAVGPATRVYGVLGSSVQRSLSPAIHNRAFAETGVDALYVPLQADSVADFMAALPSLRLAGFSVTRPYKVEILPYLDEVDETAALCGSVNTVVVHDGLLRGSTTDGVGVTHPIRLRTELRGRRCVVLGAGGAARAAAQALVKNGAQVRVLARDGAQAAAVAAAAGCESGALADAPGLEWDILINATSIGSASESPGASPLPKQAQRAGSVVLDMVYEPLETRFLREAREAGAETIDGLEMLVAQAAVQFETWTGQAAPVDSMRAAAEEALARRAS